MSILQPIDGLPDPKGSLSQTIPSRAIALANAQVQRTANTNKKRGPYQRYILSKALPIRIHYNNTELLINLY